MNHNSESFGNEFFQSEEPVNQCSESKSRKRNSPQSSKLNSQFLFSAKQRLYGFSDELGALIRTPIRKDVIEHCNKLRINSNHIVPFEKLDKMIKNRIDKMVKNKRIKQNWSSDDVFILIWVISKYADYHQFTPSVKYLKQKDWENISELIPGTSAEACMFKWLSLRKNNLSDNCWSQKQSQLLTELVKKYGDNDWTQISRNLYYTNPSQNKTFRCPKQCRQHWNCYLNPKLKKGPWSIEQDTRLLNHIVKNNGLKKWAQMVKSFEGRTQNALKNRYTLLLEKSIRSVEDYTDKTQIQIIQQYLQASYVEQFVNEKNIKENKTKQNKRKYVKKVIKPVEKRSNYKNLRSSTSRYRQKQQIQSISANDDDIQGEELTMKDTMKLDSKSQDMRIQQENIEKVNQDYYSCVLNHEICIEFSNFQGIMPKDQEEIYQKQKSEQTIVEIEDIEIAPMTPEIWQMIMDSDMKDKVIPCQMSNNTLTKIQLQN